MEDKHTNDSLFMNHTSPRKHQIDHEVHEIQEDNILWLCSGPVVRHDWKRDFRLWVLNKLWNRLLRAFLAVESLPIHACDD